MIDWLADYSLFLAKAATVVVALLIVVIAVAVTVRGARGNQPQQRLRIRSLNRRLEKTRALLEAEILDAPARKAASKARKAADKLRARERKRGGSERPRVFVMRFDGDVQASAVTALREEITAILQVARPDDEVILRLDSPGGVVHGYGLAASQLTRVRARGIRLTVAIDKVAASGGYMMAAVADQILAAPFAVVGSIGVVAQLPNFNRVLKKNDIDVELHTAGQYKRTLTVFGENSDEARQKFREELEQVHALFKHFVAEYRPRVPIERVATGEHWYGLQALELQLVDRIVTVEDYLQERADSADLFLIEYRLRQGRLAQLFKPAAQALGAWWPPFMQRLG